MVNKSKMKSAVTGLEYELATGTGDKAARPNRSDAAEPQVETSATNDEATDPELQDVEHLLEQHGLDVDELKGLWDHFLEELKDLPSKKPLVTVFGAFLLGYLAGRSGRK